MYWDHCETTAIFFNRIFMLRFKGTHDLTTKINFYFVSICSYGVVKTSTKATSKSSNSNFENSFLQIVTCMSALVGGAGLKSGSSILRHI